MSYPTDSVANVGSVRLRLKKRSNGTDLPNWKNGGKQVSCDVGQSMTTKYYVYQIKGLLERADKSIGGLVVLLCTPHAFEEVNVPGDIFDKETLAFLRYRIAVNDFLDINKLPWEALKKIREPLNKYLDDWVASGNIK